MSAEFGRAFFALGTAVVMSIVWFGYFRNVFVSRLTWAVTGFFVLYMSTFLIYRYLTSHIEEHMEREPDYILIASIHGMISLLAVGIAVYAFIRAQRAYANGENYFMTHTRLSFWLVILWPLALLSGMLL